MTVTLRVLIPSKIAESAQTTQYTAGGVKTIIDKFTATNYSGTATTLNVNLVTSGDSTSSANLVVKSKTIQPGETYTFPEVVGAALATGGFISTLAGTATAIALRASGREIS